MHYIKPGDRFNKLVAIKELPKSERNNPKKRRFLWRCDCGKEHSADLTPVLLNKTTSCGCYRDAQNRAQGTMSKGTNWKGGRRKEDGYVFIYCPDHPNSKSNGYVREHTLVMSQYLGRALEKGENVHHKNGVKDDNRLENLELWSTSQPCGQRVEDKVKWAKEILKKYGEYKTPIEASDVAGTAR